MEFTVGKHGLEKNSSSALEEIGSMSEYNTLDIEIGSKNDFEIHFPAKQEIVNKYRNGMYFFALGTEWGGKFRWLKSNTAENEIVWKGQTWRGMMNRVVIQPPYGQDYYTVSGDANVIIGKVLTEFIGDLYIFRESEETSGITFGMYQFPRYCTVLDGLTGMLAMKGARLKIETVCEWSEAAGKNIVTVVVFAESVVDHSQDIEISQDGRINFQAEDNRSGVNHLIVLGKGELKDRKVVHIGVDYDGNIVPGSTGCGGLGIARGDYLDYIEEVTEVYELSSEEDESKLIAEGVAKLKELRNSKSVRVSIDNLQVELGDIVSGRDFVTGIYASVPVVREILTVADGIERIEYKTKGED